MNKTRPVLVLSNQWCQCHWLYSRIKVTNKRKDIFHVTKTWEILNVISNWSISPLKCSDVTEGPLSADKKSFHTVQPILIPSNSAKIVMRCWFNYHCTSRQLYHKNIKCRIHITRTLNAEFMSESITCSRGHDRNVNLNF